LVSRRLQPGRLAGHRSFLDCADRGGALLVAPRKKRGRPLLRFVARPRFAFAALASVISLAACSRSDAAGSLGSRPPRDRAPCGWGWTTPETLFVQGASFGFGGRRDGPRLLPLGAGTALLGDMMSTYADTETQPSWKRLLGVSFDPSGRAALIMKPPFM